MNPTPSNPQPCTVLGCGHLAANPTSLCAEHLASLKGDPVEAVLGQLAEDVINYDQHMTRAGAPPVRFVYKHIRKAKAGIELLLLEARQEELKRVPYTNLESVDSYVYERLVVLDRQIAVELRDVLISKDHESCLLCNEILKPPKSGELK